MKYDIEIKRPALKFLRRLDKQTAKKITDTIDKLADEPRPFGYKKLVDEEGLYRVRVGNYRIIYEVQERVLLIVVLRLARRREDTY